MTATIASAEIQQIAAARMAEAQDRAMFARADNGAPMSVERLMVDSYLRERADAVGIDLADKRGKAMYLDRARRILRPSEARADGAYYNGTLRTLYSGSIFEVPTQDRGDILSGIGERRVAAGSRQYALRSVGISGKAAPYAPNATSHPRPSYDVDESEAKTYMWTFEIPDEWATRQYASFAGIDRANLNMMAMRKAFVEAEWDLRVNGYGTKIPGIANMQIPELTSTQTYAGATAVDVLFEDFAGLVTGHRNSLPAGGNYDTAIMTDRVMSAMDISNNLSAGGSATAAGVLLPMLRRLGISRVIIGKSLKDIGGTADVDGCLLFNSGDEFGLKQVRQLNPVPVHTYPGANGDNTVYVASWGATELPNLDEALLLKLPVA